MNPRDMNGEPLQPGDLVRTDYGDGELAEVTAREGPDEVSLTCNPIRTYASYTLAREGTA